MADVERCRTDDWVEVEYILLEPVDRSPGLPPETAERPLKAWVKGFARSAAAIGDEVAVTTMTGREVTGVLTEVNPGYTHTFGKPAPELVRVGRDLRQRVAEYRSGGDRAGE
jgi:2-amino-4-ketopentanoate thiolase alpha subunit